MPVRTSMQSACFMCLRVLMPWFYHQGAHWDGAAVLFVGRDGGIHGIRYRGDRKASVTR